jgi:excisionase family DNA binding protein
MQLNTISEVAERLAVSSTTVRRLIASAELPTVRVGRCLRIQEEDVRAFVADRYTAHPVNPASDLSLGQAQP